MRSVRGASTLALSLAGSLVATVGTAATAHAQARRISLAETVKLATSRNLDLAAVDLAADAADKDALSTRGNLGPKFHVDANLLLWNDKFSIRFGTMDILARDQVTSTITASVAQPLTGLYSIGERRRAQASLAGAARADGKAVRAELAFRAVEAYLRLLEAIDLSRIAEDTIGEIEEQVRIAHALVEAGTLIPADELRTRVQLSQSRQVLLRTDAQAGVARAQLAQLVGLPVDTPLDPERLDVGSLPHLPRSADLPLGLAEKNRSELSAARQRQTAAAHLGKAAWGDLLPSLSVQGAYQHNEGLGFVSPQNAGYLGGFLSWNFWEWGAQYYAAQAADVRARAGSNEVARKEREIALEVYRHFLEARAAYSAIAPAHTAVEQAREARRVTKALYENGAATTTDILTAELSLETARANDARSSYDALAAYAALARAAGVVAELPQTTAESADAAPPAPIKSVNSAGPSSPSAPADSAVPSRPPAPAAAPGSPADKIPILD